MTDNLTIIGKRYIDRQNSGSEVMKVVAFSDRVPGNVFVQHAHSDRTWQRSIDWVQSMLATVAEHKPARAVFGNDEKAINRHSVREYFCNGNRYGLDRTLDVIPPIFKLYLIPEDPGLCPTVLVNGEEYWGSGITWKKAEEIALPAIRNHTIEDSESV